jgi:hypothetical protein
MFPSVRGRRKVSQGSALARVTVDMDQMDESVTAQATSQSAGYAARRGAPTCRTDRGPTSETMMADPGRWASGSAESPNVPQHLR